MVQVPVAFICHSQTTHSSGSAMAFNCFQSQLFATPSCTFKRTTRDQLDRIILFAHNLIFTCIRTLHHTISSALQLTWQLPSYVQTENYSVLQVVFHRAYGNGIKVKSELSELSCQRTLVALIDSTFFACFNIHPVCKNTYGYSQALLYAQTLNSYVPAKVSFKQFDNQHLAPGSVIQSTVAKSPQACSYWCSKTSLCCSFSYNANSMVCTVSYKCVGENAWWLSSQADNTFVTYKESEYQNIYIRSLLQRDYLRSQIHPASTHVGLLPIKPQNVQISQSYWFSQGVCLTS